jgi:protocatechuate 3,4-dioxygenase beta subunit
MVFRTLILVVGFLFSVQSAFCFSVKGKAVSADGKTSLSGIVVKATHMRDREAGKKDEFMKTAKVGADGTFTIELPTYSDMYNVCLADEAGHYFWGQSHINGNEDLGTVKLQRGCELSGRARTKDGKPLAGVEIGLKLRLKVCHHYVDAAKTTTKPDGTFIFDDLSPGSYTYQPKSAQYAVPEGSIDVSEDPSYLELTLDKAATVKGVVKDENDKPIEGMNVTAEGFSAKTDAQGRYAISGLPKGSFYVYVAGDGYVQKEDYRDRQVKCEPGQEVEKNLVVARAGSVRLSVELENKSDKLPERLSVGFGISDKERRYSSTTYKDAELVNGEAVFKDLAPGEYNITVRKGDSTWATTNLTVVGAQEAKGRMVLPHVLTIKGKVTDGSGKPIEEAQVRSKLHVEKKADEDSDQQEFYQRMQEEQSVTTEKNGEYVLDGLKEGTKVMISVSHKDFSLTNCLVTVKQGQPAQNFVLNKGLKISGCVLESDGKPAKDVEVYVSVRYTQGMDMERYNAMSQISRSSKVDNKGGFELAGLSPGKYDLTFYRTEDEQRETETSLSGIEAGSDEVIVSLGKKHVITGSVADKDGKPMDKVNISIAKGQDSGGMTYYSRSGSGRTTKPDGTFSLTLREGSDYTISFYVYPYVQKKATVELATAAKAPKEPLKIVLERGNKVTGTVLNDKELPVNGLAVRAMQGAGMGGWFSDMDDDNEGEEGGKKKKEVTDEKGHFELDGVAPGVVTLYVSAKTNDTMRTVTTKEILVARDKPNDVKIVLPAMGSVKGRVATSDGKPVKNGSVMLWSMKGGETVTVSLGIEKAREGAMTVKGVVRKSGKPLNGGTISLVPMPKDDQAETEMMGMYGTWAKGVITSNGNFTVSNVTAGAYCYQISHGKRKPKKGAEEEDDENAFSYFSGLVTVAPNQADMSINVSGVTLSGTVSGPDGKPVTEARVTLTLSEKNRWKKQMLSRYGSTDAKGKYKLECTPAGTYNLYVQSEETGMGVVKNIEVLDKSKEVDIKIAQAFKVSGKVTVPSSAGESPEGTAVFAIADDETAFGWGQVGENGEYSLDPKLPAGKYTMFVQRAGCAIHAKAVDVKADTKHDVKLELGGNLELTVTSGGKPAKGKSVHVKTKSGDEILRLRDSEYVSGGFMAGCELDQSDADGKVSVKGLEPGKYSVTVDGSGASLSVEVKALETTDAELKL